MKIQIVFKNPDALADAFAELSLEDSEAAEAVAEKYFKWGEIVTLELDTKKQSLIVLPL